MRGEKKTGLRLSIKSEAEMLQVKLGDPTPAESHPTALLNPSLSLIFAFLRDVLH